MYSDTITVFNYHADSETWYPSVISGADVGPELHRAKTASSGLSSSDSVILLVQANADMSVDTSVGAKSYTAPKAYAHCEDPEGCITFAPEVDFFCLGAWEDLEPIDDAAYDMGLYHALNRQRDDVFMISSVAPYTLIPHYEIGGR